MAEEEKQQASDEEEDEDEEKQQSSDEENEGASRSASAASEDEEDKRIALASCSREETHRKHMLSDAQECKDEHTLSWVPTALANIKLVNGHMSRRSEFIGHPSPKTFLPDLKRVRRAAMALVHNTDATISFAKAQQNILDMKALERKLLALQQELAQSKEQSEAEHRKQDALLQQANVKLLKVSHLFRKEKESHKLERDRYIHEQRDLRRQLDEEKDKSICCVCHDKPRDTIILPCLHFQYCFPCLLRHREANSNTCPTCRGPIQGLSMSSYLATQ